MKKTIKLKDKERERKKTTPRTNIVPLERSSNPESTKILSEAERKFVNFIVRDKMNQTAAMRMANPELKSPATVAMRLLSQPRILAAIAEERATFAVASQMSKKKVIDGFIEAIDMARVQGEPLTMISGWREVGKMCGFYEPTKAELIITHKAKMTLDRVRSMSDADLLALTLEEAEAIDAEFTVQESQSHSSGRSSEHEHSRAGAGSQRALPPPTDPLHEDEPPKL